MRGAAGSECKQALDRDLAAGESLGLCLGLHRCRQQDEGEKKRDDAA